MVDSPVVLWEIHSRVALFDFSCRAQFSRVEINPLHIYFGRYFIYTPCTCLLLEGATFLNLLPFSFLPMHAKTRGGWSIEAERVAPNLFLEARGR